MQGQMIMLVWLTTAATAAVASAPPADGVPPATRPTTGPATGPTTVPSTAPAEPLDLSSPKAALRAFAAALHDGDGARLHQVVATTNPSEDRMIRAMADMAASLSALQQAASAAFGEAADGRFAGDTRRQYADSLARIETAEIAVDAGGDAASVRYPGAAQPEYQLKRVGGRWKIPMNQFSRGADAASIDRRIAESAVQTGIALELAGEITAGKHKNADAATDAWRAKIMQALGRRLPTTGPTATTTAPAKPPE